MKIAVLAVLMVALMFSLAGSAKAGTIVADSAFRPAVDGFSFENYTNEEGYVNLDAREMQRLFGRGVCLSGKGSGCVLRPAASNAMDQFNDGMSGGHCYGLSALALLIHSKKLPRFGYDAITTFGGGPPTFDLDLDKSKVLQRSIARAFSYQLLPSVNENSIDGTPKQIVDFLIKHLGVSDRETWNLGIFQYGHQAGHAITPYAVEDMGAGKFDILAYDNNLPGLERRVKVDTVKNTWSYYATTQPGYPQALYEGNAKSMTLDLSPNLPGLGVQPCPFCSGRQGGKAKYNQITLSGSASTPAHILITDRKGRQTGYRNGKLINRIAGAQVLTQTSGGVRVSAGSPARTTVDSPEPVYLLPKKLKLRIKIDGRRMKSADVESLGVVGPTFDSTIEKVRMGPGKVAYASLSPKKKTLSFTKARGKSSPEVSFGAQSQKVAYRIYAATPGAKTRSTVFFQKKPRLSLLRIGSKSKATPRWSVKIDVDDGKGNEVTIGARYRVRRGQIAFLNYGPLAKDNPAYVQIVSPNRQKVRRINMKVIEG